MTKRNLSDLGAALLVVAFGCYVVATGLEMSVGSLRRIGPGFFPICLGAVMAVLGLALAFERSEEEVRERFPFVSLGLVSLAILSFAVLVERAGLFPAILGVVLLTNLAEGGRLSLPSLAATVVGLCAAGYLIFILMLNLPLEPLRLPGFAGA